MKNPITIITKTIYKETIGLLKYVIRRITRVPRNIMRKAAIGYIALLLPANLITATSITHTNPLNPDTWRAISNTGIVNILTGGLLKPIIATIQGTPLTDIYTVISDEAQHLMDTVGKPKPLAPQAPAQPEKPKRTALDLAKNRNKTTVDVVDTDDTMVHIMYSPGKQNEHIRQTGVTEDIATELEHNNEANYAYVKTDSIPWLTTYNLRCNGGDPTKPYVYKTDKEGRPQFACGIITKEKVDSMKGVRLPFEPDSDPTGWPAHNPELTLHLGGGKMYHGYAFNRSHLIANQLGGRAFKDNLITGTRMQNVGKDNEGGMRKPEKLAVKLLEDKPDCNVEYRAEPYFTNSQDLVPLYVDVTVASIRKDQGQSEACDFSARFTVPNVMPDFLVNYHNGTLVSRGTVSHGR